MDRSVEIEVEGMTLRGIEHMPEAVHEGPVPAVILYHGFTATKTEPHRLFVKIGRTLAKHGIAAFRFDFSGSGDSDGDFEDMTVSGEVRDAKAILQMVKADERIRSDEVSLLGLSLGGLIASLTAGDLPNDVNKLILLAAAGNFREIMAQSAQAAGVDRSADVFDHEGDLLGRGLLEDLQTLDTYPRAKGFQGPVLLIHGKADDLVPYQVALDYQSKAYGENATLHLMEEADHTFNRHTWEVEVIDEIVKFVTA